MLRRGWNLGSAPFLHPDGMVRFKFYIKEWQEKGESEKDSLYSHNELKNR